MNTPKIFLSYTRADLSVVQQLEQGLLENGISVWRDQEKIRGGQRWPKVLGEEISRHDFLLLAWSENSKDSDFVELEWCTAVALKKIIVPWLLDETPLPASLTAIHRIDAKEPAKALPDILKAMRSEVQETDQAHNAEVIRKLGNISATEPKEVLEVARRTIFDQRGWTVQGSVYQAARDIHITTGSSTSTEKSQLERWHTGVRLVVGVLTAIVLFGALVAIVLFVDLRAIFPVFEQSVDQPLGGCVLDERNNKLPEVRVTLRPFGQTASTDQEGCFQLRIRAPKHADIELIAEKKGFKDRMINVKLGDAQLSWKMERIQ